MRFVIFPCILGLFTSAAFSAQAQVSPETPPQTPEAAAQKLALTEKVAKAELLAAEARADVAKAETQTAKAEAQTAKEKKDAAETRLAEARAGKLVKYGVTAGFATIGQSGSFYDGRDGAGQESLELTTMPYLAVLPGYWTMPDLNRIYCASDYLSADQVDATKAAMAQADRLARLDLSDTERAALDGPDSDAKTAAKAKLEEGSRKKWDPTKAGSCWSGKVGLYVGKPLAYDASVVSVEGGEEMTRSVTPTISGGLIFLPNAYIAVLVGISHSRFTEPAKAATATEAATPEATRRFLSLSVGIGGNLDLLGALVD